MIASVLSLNESVERKKLRQLQATLEELASEQEVPLVAGMYDFSALLQDMDRRADKGGLSVTRGKDGILIVVSSNISVSHINPYNMSVFAASNIEAAGMRAELLAWLDYASEHLETTREDIVSGEGSFVSWYEALASTSPGQIEALARDACIAGLVSKYCHTEANQESRRNVLNNLKNMSNQGVAEADSVFKLLTSPTTSLIGEEELNKDVDAGDSPLSRLHFRLLEESNELEIRRPVGLGNPDINARYPLNSLLGESRRANRPIRIVFAGDREDIYFIYCLYTLLRHQIDDANIKNVIVDIGIFDSEFYIDTDDKYVRLVKEWFRRARMDVPGLSSLVRQAVLNDTSGFRLERGGKYWSPGAEELVLFFLRLLSPHWNDAFVAIIKSRQEQRVLTQYIEMMDKMMREIPKVWKSLIESHMQYCDFVRQQKPRYSETINSLQPVNLLTDEQAVQADVIILAGRGVKNRMLRRFPGSVVKKVVLLGEMVSGKNRARQAILESPYNPGSIFSGPKWDDLKEKVIRSQLVKYVLPVLKAEVTIDKVKAIRLVAQKKASSEAIECIQRYITSLQKISARGQDQMLTEGLIFVLAVIRDISPESVEWNEFHAHYRSNREALQSEVFGSSKRRVFTAKAAAKFLANYIGPKKYVDKVFHPTYQKYNEEILGELIRRVGDQMRDKEVRA